MIWLKVYMKATHTDQSLMFDFHHPIQHKVSVVRTLLCQKDKILTKKDGQLAEEAHINKALQACKYLTKAIQKVKQQLAEKKNAPKRKPDRKKD